MSDHAIESSLSPEERQKVKIVIGEEASQLPKILPLVRQMHRESMFADFPFDEPQFEKIAAFIKDEPGFHGGLYAEHEGTPAAFAYYLFRPFLGSRKNWVTVMHTLYIRSDLRSTPVGGYIWSRIMLAVRGWSTPRGSKGVLFNVMSGIAVEETNTVLRASDATYLGGNYLLRI